MKFLVLFAGFILAINAASDRELWAEFKAKHGKEYRNLLQEQKRFTIFQENLRKIEAHNELYQKGEKTYSMKTTQFADMSHEEFVGMLNTSRPTLEQVSKFNVKNFDDISLDDVPASVDWRDSGLVTGVKNQGSCGGCWSFAATGTLEGIYAKKTGNLVSLSEQNLIDCSTSYGNVGCDGGTVHSAIDYVSDVGIELESDYPYQGTDASCAFTSSKSVLKANGYVAVTYGSESDLLKAVGTVGPVAVSVDADSYQFYSSGVFDETSCTTNVDHGVLVVGYGTQDGADYWLVKNSWGADWGESGYIKMARNKNGQCGIDLWAVYPNL